MAIQYKIQYKDPGGTTGKQTGLEHRQDEGRTLSIKRVCK